LSSPNMSRLDIDTKEQCDWEIKHAADAFAQFHCWMTE
jgi:hypothetical protein